MRLDLTDDQQFFQETVRRFVTTETPIDVVRGRIEADEAFDRAWWRRAAELGFTSFMIPEAAGGGSVSGRAEVDLVIVAEELGRNVVPHPLLPSNVVAMALGESDNASAHGETIAGIVDGSIVAAWASAHASLGTTTEATPIVAESSDDGFVLDGTVSAIEAADQADIFLVTANSDAGPTQFLVPAGTAGVSVAPQEGLDLLRRFANVRFDNVSIGADSLVGSVGGAAASIERQTQLAMLVQCAEMVGATARVLEFTIDWSFDRFSFGRPLASYQALKHRFADMKLWLEASHAITDDAAWAMSSGDTSGSRVHAAKSYVGDRSVDIIQDCVQLHGGIGVTWEHDIHLYLRRATVNRGLFGNPSDHRTALAVGLGL